MSGTILKNQKPAIPDHELLRCIGSGSYGEVWLARNVMGNFRAVKIVYRRTFENDRPFEREFNGIQKFEPISRSDNCQVDILHIGRHVASGILPDVEPGLPARREEASQLSSVSNNSAPQPGGRMPPSTSGRMPDATEEDYFYYVMELADDQTRGQQIDPDSYAPRTLSSEMNQHGRLPIAECLDIGLALSGALEHLHKNGLVHRDVKPSNVIFVNGIPKLADIGLVTDTAATMSFVGTEGFFPPEGPGSPQADIYSLGKVLYEISTGKDRKDFPEPPTLLGEFSDRDELLEFGEVVKKACANDVRERYASAEAMQSDLLLLKTGKSIRQTHRLERRLKLATRVGIAAGIIAVIAVGAYFFAENQTRKAQEISETETRLRRAAEASETKAQTEAAKSQQVAAFMKDMLNGVGPSVALGRDTMMLREILDKTAERISKDLVNQPEVEAELRLTIGRVYLEINQDSQAEAMLRPALAYWRTTNGHEDKIADLLNQLAIALRKQGKSEEAETALNEALALEKKFFGNEHPSIATSFHLLAGLSWKRGRLDEAETLYRQAMEMRRKLLGEENDDFASSLNHLAIILNLQGKSATAESLHRHALAIYRKLHGNDHPGTVWCLGFLAGALADQNKLAEAVFVRLEAQASQSTPHDQAWSYRNRKTRLELAQMYERGEGIAKDEIEAGKLYRKVAEECHQDAAQGDIGSQRILAGMYDRGEGVAKDATEAAKWYRKVAEQYRKKAETNDIYSQRILAGMYDRGEGVAKDATEAAKWYRKVAEQYRKKAETGDLTALNNAAWFFAAGGNAETRDGHSAITFAEKVVEATNRKTPRYLDTLATAYAEAGQFEKAVSVQNEAIALEQNEKSKAEYSSRLKLYESNSPYRE